MSVCLLLYVSVSECLPLYVSVCLCVVSFLNQCRPLSVSMGNAIKYLKNQITHIASTLTAEEVVYSTYCTASVIHSHYEQL